MIPVSPLSSPAVEYSYPKKALELILKHLPIHEIAKVRATCQSWRTTSRNAFSLSNVPLTDSLKKLFGEEGALEMQKSLQFYHLIRQGEVFFPKNERIPATASYHILDFQIADQKLVLKVADNSKYPQLILFDLAKTTHSPIPVNIFKYETENFAFNGKTIICQSLILPEYEKSKQYYTAFKNIDEIDFTFVCEEFCARLELCDDYVLAAHKSGVIIQKMGDLSSIKHATSPVWCFISTPTAHFFTYDSKKKKIFCHTFLESPRNQEKFFNTYPIKEVSVETDVQELKASRTYLVAKMDLNFNIYTINRDHSPVLAMTIHHQDLSTEFQIHGSRLIVFGETKVTLYSLKNGERLFSFTLHCLNEKGLYTIEKQLYGNILFVRRANGILQIVDLLTGLPLIDEVMFPRKFLKFHIENHTLYALHNDHKIYKYALLLNVKRPK